MLAHRSSFGVGNLLVLELMRRAVLYRQLISSSVLNIADLEEQIRPCPIRLISDFIPSDSDSTAQ